VLLPVLAFAAIGFACAIASSIVAVLIPDGGQHTPRTSARYNVGGDQTVYVFMVRRPGYTLMAVTGPMPTWAANELDKIRSQEIPLRPGDPRPAWLRREVLPNPQSPAESPQTSRGIAAGWPWHCLWGRTDRNVNFRPQTSETGVAWVTVAGVRRAFPWYPLWFGLIGNATVYGGCMLAMWFAGVFVFRHWRRVRGRCPACGYPTAPDQPRCPECGALHRRQIQPTGSGSSTASSATPTSSAQTTSTLTSKSSSNEDK